MNKKSQEGAEPVDEETDRRTDRPRVNSEIQFLSSVVARNSHPWIALAAGAKFMGEDGVFREDIECLKANF
jgi:hypothetical protein